MFFSILREPLHFNFFKDVVFFQVFGAGYFVVDEFLGGVEVFHEVIVVVEFDYVDVVFCFFVDELETPAVPSFRSCVSSPKPGGFLRELSQSCVKDVFVGLYAAEVGEPRHAVGVQFLPKRNFSSPLWMVAGKMRTPPW
jgi:hypothetical protein